MKRIISCFLLVSAGLTACQPENLFIPEKEKTSLEDFYSDNRSSVQSFSVSNSTGGMITTAHNVKIYFPANGFVTENGTPVGGNIDIQVKEILTPQEMIFNNMPTMSGGLPLESGGEFRIGVAKNGESLKLAAGEFLEIGIPRAGGISMSNMQVFNGVTNAKGEVDWRLNTNPGNFVVPDSVLFASSTLFCDSINWINCDKLIDEPTVTFSVYPGNAPSNDSTDVFVHLTGRNTIVKMSWVQGMSYFRSDNMLAAASTIIGISVKNGQLYASLTPVTVRNGQSVTMDFSAYPEARLKERLRQLK